MKILLKKIREERKLSLRQMEIMTGLSKSALSRIENGEVSMTLHEAER
ncbi:helix-turn-helix domain-containing protein [Enterocloster citroniae]